MSDMSLLCKALIREELREREPLFGHWRVTGFIGAGANGCVFKMERQDLGQNFVAALKVIPMTIDSRRTRGGAEVSLEASIGRDAKEILHLYRLSGHTNVVGWHNHQIIEKREEDALQVFILLMMDYLPNSLGEELKRGPLPAERAIDLLIGCLHGLEHIHKHHIIHRDIKPANIFIAESDVPKIGDFGISRQMSESSQAQTVAGTPVYMAPEVFSDPSGRGYDERADIYSMGLVAYEMLEGWLPFETESTTRAEMVQKRFAGRQIVFTRELPPGLTEAILRALRYDPAARFPSAKAFREALETVRQGPKTARPLLGGARLLARPGLKADRPEGKPPGRGRPDLPFSTAALGRGRGPDGFMDVFPTIAAPKPSHPATTKTTVAGKLWQKPGRPLPDPDSEETLLLETAATQRRPGPAPKAPENVPPPRFARDAGRPAGADDQDATLAATRKAPPRPAAGPEDDTVYVATAAFETINLGDSKPSLKPLPHRPHSAREASARATDEHADQPGGGLEDWCAPDLTFGPETTSASSEEEEPEQDKERNALLPGSGTRPGRSIPRRLVRIIECDAAIDFVIYTRLVCEKIIELARQQIAAHGHVPVELGNRLSPRVDEKHFCGGIVSLGLVDTMIMAEMEIWKKYHYEVENLIDGDGYRIIPKYLGFYLQRGEKRIIKPENLQLLAFSLYSLAD